MGSTAWARNLNDAGQTSTPGHATQFASLLKACAQNKDLCRGVQLHADIVARGLLPKSSHIACALVSMYAKCGAFSKAQQLLHELPCRDVASWNALIAGYAQQGLGEEAFVCYKHMQHEGFNANEMTFTSLLKSCCSAGADKAKQIRDEIVCHGLLRKNTLLGNALLDMYVKCGELSKAHQVLNELHVRDVVSWSVLIAGYAQEDQGLKALSCFDCMQHEGLSSDAVTLACTLKACGSVRAADKGKEIHEEIVRQGLLTNDIVLGTALIDMYAKCGALMQAHGVIEELPDRNVISWSALIEGLTQDGQGKEALKCFERMRCEGLFPNLVTLTSILKACGSIGAADKGKQIHDEIARQGLLDGNIVLCNALVDMYAKCGAIAKAQQVFSELPRQDTVSWNALIAGYAEHGQGMEALKCFEMMQVKGLSTSAATFVPILKACGSIGAADKGDEICDAIVTQGLLQGNYVLGCALVDMYAKCGVFSKAHQVFDEILVRNIVAWNVLIAGYAQAGHGEEALNCYDQLKSEGLLPNTGTFICILKACAILGASDIGKQIHDEIICQELLPNNDVLATALVDMYAKCNSLTNAQKVIDELPDRDVVSWSALIAGYSQQGKGDEALVCFEQMQREALPPNEVTYACILKACSSVGALDKGKQIHCEIVSHGFMGKDTVLGVALLDMYAKCGALTKAQEVLDKLHVWNEVSWSALIAGYALHGQGEEALSCFEQMQSEGFSPGIVTFISILRACASVGAAHRGKQIHDEIVIKALLGEDIALGNVMVDMYAKCGLLSEAVRILEELPVRNVVTWNIIIAGYAQHMQVKEALKCLERMQFENLPPDAITFLSLLNAYSRAGLVIEGAMYFVSVSIKDGILPALKHYTCMVDLLSRVGQLERAAAVIQRLPISGYLPIWSALLASCQKWGNMELGKWAFEHAIQLYDNGVVHLNEDAGKE